MTQAHPHHTRPAPRWPQPPQHAPAAGSPQRRARRERNLPRPGHQAAGAHQRGELLPHGHQHKQPLSLIPPQPPRAASLGTRGRRAHG
jgi:hypothetical protein